MKRGDMMNYNEYACSVIKKLRKERGVEVLDVAEAIGYKSAKGYWEIETGRIALKLKTLEALAKFYNVPVGIFFAE